MEDKRNMSGENHPRWKGGRTTTKRGYVFISMPNHHRANSVGYVFEHIVVMEKKLGRKIKRKDGQIHHKDNNPSNNDPDNLELLTPLEHRLLHFKLRGWNVKSTKHKSRNLVRNTKGSDKVYTSGDQSKVKGKVVPKEKLPRGYYYLKII